MANKTFHIPKSAIVKSEDNVSILEGKQQTITTDASAVATLTNTDGFKAAHYSIAAERDGEVTTTTTTTTTTVTGSGTSIDADTKLLLNANYIYDQSFSKKDITLNNTEIVRKGYAFDGNGGISATSSDFTFGTGNFTIEFWLKKSSSPSNKQRLFGIGTFNQSGQLSIMLNNSNGGIILRKGTGSDQSQILSDSTNVCDDTWHHIAITRSSTSLKLFIDGVQKQSVTDSTDFSQSALEIGEDTGLDSLYSSGQYDYSGYLADIRISKGVARYTADFDELVTTKDSNHKLILTGETTDQVDSSRSITFSGAHPTAKFGQGSFYFDGSDHMLCGASPISGTDDFTIEFWALKTENNSNNGSSGFDPVITSNVGGGSLPDWIMELSTQRGFIFYYYNSETYGYEVSDSTLGNIATDGKWHHYAFVRESGVFKLYVDGVYYANTSTTYTTSTTSSILDNGTITVGSYTWTNNSLWRYKGYLSDIRISKGVARYTAAFNNDLPTAPLETEDSRTKLLLNVNSALQDFEIGRMALAPTYAGDTKVVRRGYAFDGSDDYISLPNSNDFDLSSGDFTFEAWVYPTDSTDSAIFHFGNTYGSSQGLALAYWKSGSEDPRFRLYVNDSQITACTSDQFAPNNWYHVALVRDSGNFRIYVNGVAQGSATSATHTHNSTNLNIGYYNNIYYFSGYMSDIRITKGEALYTSAFTPPESLSVGTNTKLLLSGAETDDYDSDRSITFSGTAHPTAKFGDGSYYFDGTDDYIKIDGSDFPVGSELFDGDLTIEAWYQRSGTISGDLFLIDKTASGTGWGLYWNTNSYYGTANSWIFTSANNTTTSDDGPTGANVLIGGVNVGAPNDGEWHHIAVVKSGDNYAMYIDGVQKDTATKSYKPTDTTSQHLYIGSYRGNGTHGFSGGYADDIRISKGVARYTASFDVPTSELGSGTGTTTSTSTTTTTTTGSSDVVLTKVHLVHDGSNVYFTEYGRTATDDDFLELSASYDAGVAKLHASTTSGSATLELTKKEFDFSTD